MKKVGIDTKTYLTENNQNIQTASLDHFKRIVIKDGMLKPNNGKEDLIDEHSLKNAAECKRRKGLTGKHSAIYCQVCFPHNINGFQ